MTTPLESLVACGTKLWLDSVDPQFVEQNRRFGATGATSNPIIIADIIKSGRYDDELAEFVDQGLDDEEIAWQMTDRLVRQAQDVFAEVNVATKGDDGYVSFELDPLLEDASCTLSTAVRTARYIELGKQWAAGHSNRMIKVPATPAGLAALEELVAAGITVNVTLIFTTRQYHIARDNVWRGARRRKSLDRFKSVYSIFISRIDVYTKTHVPNLSAAAQGLVGIVNVKRIWGDNHEFWKDKGLALKQELIFASTGTKDPVDPPDKYVSALAGSDIQTNPPGTNTAIQSLKHTTFSRTVDEMPSSDVLDEIDNKVDISQMEAVLMDEGLKKFAEPHKALLALIGEKRSALTTGRV